MRRFFTVLFIISIIATGAVYYWRTYQPEQTIVVAKGDDPEASSSNKFSTRSFSTESASPESERLVSREPSQRQDLAMMISVVSSVISALAAMFQTFLTAKAVRDRI